MRASSLLRIYKRMACQRSSIYFDRLDILEKARFSIDRLQLDFEPFFRSFLADEWIIFFSESRTVCFRSLRIAFYNNSRLQSNDIDEKWELLGVCAWLKFGGDGQDDPAFGALLKKLGAEGVSENFIENLRYSVYRSNQAG